MVLNGEKVSFGVETIIRDGLVAQVSTLVFFNCAVSLLDLKNLFWITLRLSSKSAVKISILILYSFNSMVLLWQLLVSSFISHLVVWSLKHIFFPLDLIDLIWI
jgi:hypothetical protein